MSRDEILAEMGLTAVPEHTLQNVLKVTSQGNPSTAAAGAWPFEEPPSPTNVVRLRAAGGSWVAQLNASKASAAIDTLGAGVSNRNWSDNLSGDQLDAVLDHGLECLAKNQLLNGIKILE